MLYGHHFFHWSIITTVFGSSSPSRPSPSTIVTMITRMNIVNIVVIFRLSCEFVSPSQVIWFAGREIPTYSKIDLIWRKSIMKDKIWRNPLFLLCCSFMFSVILSAYPFSTHNILIMINYAQCVVWSAVFKSVACPAGKWYCKIWLVFNDNDTVQVAVSFYICCSVSSRKEVCMKYLHRIPMA